MCEKGWSPYEAVYAKKPHKYGFKLVVLAGVSGFAYNFEIYTGAEKTHSVCQVNMMTWGLAVQS